MMKYIEGKKIHFIRIKGLGNKSQLILVGIENGGKDFGIYTAGTAADQSGIGSISRIWLWV
jgi:hypothetical protein